MSASQIKKSIWVIFCSLVVIASLITVVFNDIVWDDEALLSAHTSEKPEQRTVFEVVTSDLFSGSAYSGAKPLPFWRPLTSLMLETTGRIFGSFLPGYHLVSLLALIFASVVFFFVALRIFGVNDRLLIFFTCTLWAVHPVGADVVAMVANMADHLSLGFLFLCLWASFKILETGVKAKLVLGLFLFVTLACAAKELGVIAVFMPVASLAFVQRPITGATTKRLMAALAVCVTSVAAYLFARNTVLGPLDIPALREPVEWLLIFPSILGLFLSEAIVFTPSPTAISIGPGSWLYFTLGLGFLLTCGICIASGLKTKRIESHTTAFGLLFCLLTLAVSSLSITPRGGIAEIPPRYFHVPLAGFFVAALPYMKRLLQRDRRPWMAITAAALLVAMGMVTFTRLSDWNTGISLWTAEVEYSPDDVDAHIHLGWALVKEKRLGAAAETIKKIKSLQSLTSTQEAQRLALEALVLSGRERLFDEAIEKLEHARKLTPNDPSLVIGIYKMHLAAGRESTAREFMKKALQEPSLSSHRAQYLLMRQLQAL